MTSTQPGQQTREAAAETDRANGSLAERAGEAKVWAASTAGQVADKVREAAQRPEVTQTLTNVKTTARNQRKPLLAGAAVLLVVARIVRRRRAKKRTLAAQAAKSVRRGLRRK